MLPAVDFCRCVARNAEALLCIPRGRLSILAAPEIAVHVTPLGWEGSLDPLKQCFSTGPYTHTLMGPLSFLHRGPFLQRCSLSPVS